MLNLIRAERSYSHFRKDDLRYLFKSREPLRPHMIIISYDDVSL